MEKHQPHQVQRHATHQGTSVDRPQRTVSLSRRASRCLVSNPESSRTVRRDRSARQALPRSRVRTGRRGPRAGMALAAHGAGGTLPRRAVQAARTCPIAQNDRGGRTQPAIRVPKSATECASAASVRPCPVEKAPARAHHIRRHIDDLRAIRATAGDVAAEATAVLIAQTRSGQRPRLTARSRRRPRARDRRRSQGSAVSGFRNQPGRREGYAPARRPETARARRRPARRPRSAGAMCRADAAGAFDRRSRSGQAAISSSGLR